MQAPIGARAGGRGAAQSIRYSLALACASLFLILASGCSAEDADGGPDSKARAAEREADAVQDRDATGEPTVPTTRPATDSAPVVLFLGTSLTAGYGLPESQAFPALIQEEIDAVGLGYRVVNAGVSGDTSAGGLRRLGWLLRLPVEVLVLELGANDMLRGQSVAQLRANLASILERTSKAHPDARFLIAGMRAAPNLGRSYVDAFDAVYPELAAKYDARLVPFLLEDVAARPDLNQADGIHPTAEGHRLIAERIWPVLRELLR